MFNVNGKKHTIIRSEKSMASALSVEAKLAADDNFIVDYY